MVLHELYIEMEDSVKIGVLMICYQHWKTKQIRRCHIINVTRTFRYLIRNITDSSMCDESMCLKMPSFWMRLSNLLIKDFCPTYESVSIRLPVHRLARHLHTSWLDVYHLNLSLSQLLNVDSIVCLF